MKGAITALILGLGIAGAPAAQAGCIKGALIGGVAGHFAGHHGLLGAAAGCAIGHHEATRHREQHDRQQFSGGPMPQGRDGRAGGGPGQQPAGGPGVYNPGGPAGGAGDR